MVGPLVEIYYKEKGSELEKHTRYGVFVNEMHIVKMEEAHDKDYGDCCMLTLVDGSSMMVTGSAEDMVNRYNMDGRR